VIESSSIAATLPASYVLMSYLWILCFIEQFFPIRYWWFWHLSGTVYLQYFVLLILQLFKSVVGKGTTSSFFGLRLDRSSSLSETGSDSTLPSLQIGHLSTVIPWLRHDAHQKHDSHRMKRICLKFRLILILSFFRWLCCQISSFPYSRIMDFLR